MLRVKIVTFRDLQVWQEAMELAVDCYRLTARLPKHELFGGLATQIRRAAASIPSNVAEGKVRPLAARLDLVCAEDLRPILERLNRIGRMLNGLRASLERF